MLFSGGVSVFVCIRETEQRDRQNMRELDAQRDIQSLCQWDQEFKEETGRPPPVSRRFSICELEAALACCKVRASSPSFSSLFPLGIPGAFFIAQHSARGCTEVCPRTEVLEQCSSVWVLAPVLPYQSPGTSGLGPHIPLYRSSH